MKLPVALIAGLALPVFAACFVAIWLGVVALIATAGGWRDLARDYPAHGEPAPETVRFTGVSLMFGSGPISLGSYRNAVTITIDATGFGLTTMMLFRFRHPPIAIPWGALRDHREGSTFGQHWVELGLANGQRLRITGRAAAALAKALAAAAPSPQP